MATVYINGVKAKRMAIGTTEIANILKGTSDPSSSIGSDGQLYLKYIPDDYTVLSYIQSNQSDGKQYIDTGIVPTFNTRVQIKYRFMNAHTANDVLIGSRIEGDSDKRFFPASIDEGTVLKDRYVMGSQSITHSSSTQGIREVDFNNSNHQVVYEGVAIDTFSSSVYSGNPNTMYLFGAHDTNGLNFEASAKLYYCRIEDTSTGQTLKEYIPVKRNSDDEIGLYDTVSGTFFENEGSGAFTAGDSIGSGVVSSSFAKVNDQWQNLIGTDIDAIQSGGEPPVVPFEKEILHSITQDQSGSSTPVSVTFTEDYQIAFICGLIADNVRTGVISVNTLGGASELYGLYQTRYVSAGIAIKIPSDKTLTGYFPYSDGGAYYDIFGAIGMSRLPSEYEIGATIDTSNISIELSKVYDHIVVFVGMDSGNSNSITLAMNETSIPLTVENQKFSRYSYHASEELTSDSTTLNFTYSGGTVADNTIVVFAYNE